MSAVAAPSAFAPSTTALKPRTRDARNGRRAVKPSRAVTASTGTLEKLYLEPIKKIEGTVTLPGSKSMSNRILLLAALAKGKTKVLNLLDSDDIRFMVDALKQLGLEITEDRDNNVLEIEGCAGKFAVEGTELFLSLIHI